VSWANLGDEYVMDHTSTAHVVRPDWTHASAFLSTASPSDMARQANRLRSGEETIDDEGPLQQEAQGARSYELLASLSLATLYQTAARLLDAHGRANISCGRSWRYAALAAVVGQARPGAGNDRVTHCVTHRVTVT
jgi:hypothetical protein